MASFCWQPRMSGLCQKWNWLSLGSKSNTLGRGSFWPTSLTLHLGGTNSVHKIADGSARGGPNAQVVSGREAGEGL